MAYAKSGSTSKRDWAALAPYSDCRLAALYEALNPAARDTAFYLDLAGRVLRTILDMGCGTGLLACDLARRGHRVSGADPAAAMLDYARHRPGGDMVEWIETDAAGLDVDARYDLVTMTGHVFQVFPSDDATAAALCNLERHLGPGGRIAFETRNPAIRPWRAWTLPHSRRTIDVPGLGSADTYTEVTSLQGELVTFDQHVRFENGAAVQTSSTLRFPSAPAIEAILHAVGLTDVRWFGDWDRSPLGPDSPEMICIAARS